YLANMEPLTVSASGQQWRLLCPQSLPPNSRRLRDHILALHEAAGKLARRDVFEHDVVWQVAEERHAAADQHGHARDNQSLNEPRQKKPLNRDPAVDVNVPDAATLELRQDVARIPRHALDARAGRRRGEDAA